MTEKSELELIEERRAARRKATAEAKEAQRVVDLKALDALEEEHGESRLRVLYVSGYVPGAPTMAVVKSPGGTSYWKRFQDQIRNAKGNRQLESAAQDMLARACLAYPSEPEALAAMLAAFPNMLNDVAGAAAGLARLETEEEKKD